MNEQIRHNLRSLFKPASRGVCAAASVLVAACGGGSGDSASSGSSYVSWNGSANGDVVVDRNNDRFRVRASDGGVEVLSGSAMNGLRVRNAVIELNNVPIGTISLVKSTTGSDIAAFVCNSGALADIAFTANNQYSVDCGAPAAAPTPAPAPVPAPAPPPAGGWITWNGSANGDVVLDRNNERFRVRASSGEVVTDQGVTLNGLKTIGASLYSGSSLIGSVSLAAATNGGQVAVFRCSNGTVLDVTVASSSYTIDCSTGSGTNPPSGNTPRFITWNGSANGEWIVDNSNDRFRVNADTLEVIDQSNSRLLGTRVSGTTLTINGTAVASVTAVLSTTGQRIAAFVCGNNKYLEIYDVSSTQFRYTCDGTRTPLFP